MEVLLFSRLQRVGSEYCSLTPVFLAAGDFERLDSFISSTINSCDDDCVNADRYGAARKGQCDRNTHHTDIRVYPARFVVNTPGRRSYRPGRLDGVALHT